MFDTNPSLIQDGPQHTHIWAPKPTPLILIHDGGGTIFSYYCLDTLSPARPLYGIANPHYHSGESFEGGIPQMARHYLSLIRSTFSSGGEVLLGGWSLGGLISLAIAELARGTDLKVVGILMVDSVCPIGADPEKMRKAVRHGVAWGESTREDTKEKVLRCFSEAFRMVNEWELPEWGDDRWGAKPPPVVLLRAKEWVPVPEEAEGEGAVSRVDLHRDDRLLGWGGYRKDLVRKVVDIPGHHFNIFAMGNNLDVVGQEIGKACVELEKFGR